MSRLRLENGAVLATDAVVAKSLPARLVGLLNRAALAPGEALLIPRCQAIHTWFMRFPIDVVFLNQAQRVVRVCPRVGPFRLLGARGAHAVIELPAGLAAERSVRSGCLVLVEPSEA